MLTRDQLSTFLHYGFFPSPVEGYRDLPWARVPADAVARDDRPTQAFLAEGRSAFQGAIEDLLTPGEHVLPLSGGVDSRFLLGALLEAGIGGSLTTVTFGVPGSFDYEIAPLVARAAGVRHEAIDLSKVEPGPGELEETLRAAPWTHAFEALYNHLLPRRCSPGAIFWSGYMANSMSGIDVEAPSSTWAIACAEFARTARIVSRVRLAPQNFDPAAALPREPLLEGSCLTYYEQLFLFLRHPRRNELTLLPRGHDYRAPFRHPAWVDFALRLPRRHRRQQRLYYRLVQTAYPALFDLPTKNNLGLPLGAPRPRVFLRRAALKLEREVKLRLPRWVHRADPKLNYDDYETRLRAPGWMRDVVEDALDGLALRQAVDWLDLPELRRAHLRGEANHGDALTLLASLELHLRTLEAGGEAPPANHFDSAPRTLSR